MTARRGRRCVGCATMPGVGPRSGRAGAGGGHSAAAVHVTASLVAVDQDDDCLMLVLGSVAYMRIGVVLHAVKEREESYWDDYDDREMETMKVPYDQLLVVVDTVVDENPMQDSGDEIDVLMDVPVGETYHVERQQ